MIDYLGPKATDRKLRLFVCACCRMVWPELTDPRSRAAVKVAERFAEGQSNDVELEQTHRAADAVAKKLAMGYRALYAAAAATATLNRTAFSGQYNRGLLGHRVCDVITHSAPFLLRDMFGPLPLRPIAVDPACLTWNNATVPAIARHVCDDRAFHDLPILADALEDAGCTDPEILGHCRGDGPHVRGCWVVDLILGKA
jgi:hypothetical protein